MVSKKAKPVATEPEIEEVATRIKLVRGEQLDGLDSFGDNWVPHGAPKEKEKIEEARKHGHGFYDATKLICQVELRRPFGEQINDKTGEDESDRFVAVRRFKEDDDGYLVELVGAPTLLMPDHGGLLKSLKKAKPGILEIAYEGKEVLKTGRYKGKEFHKYAVWQITVDD